MSWYGFRERWAKTAAEALLVALFLLLFLVLLRFLFPEGTGLRGLIRGGDEESVGTAEGVGRFGSNAREVETLRTVSAAGYVAAMRNDVQSRRANSIAWGRAETGMNLYARDAVQTSGNSSASIWLGGKGSVNLGEKSLLIIRSMEKDLETGAKRSILLMVEGELRGRIEGSKREAVSIDVASVGGVGRIVSRGGAGGAADFRVTVNPDKTTTYSVFEGSAFVEGMGRTVRVGANQYTIVAPNAAPTDPAALPGAPVIAGPGDGEEYFFRSLPPRVRFAWTVPEPAESYRVVLARDPEFKETVVDEWVAGTLFTHGNLPEGTYYWRVTAKRGGVESGYPKARTVRLVKKVQPPPLRAEAIPDPGRGDFCTVRGATAPGVSLLVAGKPVPPDGKGDFECFVPLEPGINTIVVEASDAAGNTAYSSLRVNGR